MSGSRPTADEVRARIEAFRARRGYVLAHQGVMAAALHELQDSYGVIYRALTLLDLHLTPFEKEFVWLTVLVGAEERVGTHHIALFRKTGGTDRQAQAAWRLAAFGEGAGAYAFLAREWQPHFRFDAHEAYREAVRALIAGHDVPEGLAWLALVAHHTGQARHWGIEAALLGAYGAGVDEGKIAEAMSLALWPKGMNQFVTAAEIWREMILDGRLAAGEAFRAWAETPDQDGFKLP